MLLSTYVTSLGDQGIINKCQLVSQQLGTVLTGHKIGSGARRRPRITPACLTLQ